MTRSKMAKKKESILKNKENNKINKLMVKNKIKIEDLKEGKREANISQEEDKISQDNRDQNTKTDNKEKIPENGNRRNSTETKDTNPEETTEIEASPHQIIMTATPKDTKERANSLTEAQTDTKKEANNTTGVLNHMRETVNHMRETLSLMRETVNRMTETTNKTKDKDTEANPKKEIPRSEDFRKKDKIQAETTKLNNLMLQEEVTRWTSFIHQ